MPTSLTPAAPNPELVALAELALQLGATRVELGVSHDAVTSLLEYGATLHRVVIRYEGEEPYVLARASLELRGLAIEARRPVRPASPEEARALESPHAYAYLGTYQGVDL